MKLKSRSFFGQAAHKKWKQNNCFWLNGTMFLVPYLTFEESTGSWVLLQRLASRFSALTFRVLGLGFQVLPLKQVPGLVLGVHFYGPWQMVNVPTSENRVPGIGSHQRFIILGPTFQICHWDWHQKCQKLQSKIRKLQTLYPSFD